MVRQRAKERACERAIKRTLAYRTTFKYPLSFHQLSTLLISKKTFTYKFFKKELRRLAKNKSVRVRKGKYYLPNTKPVSWHVRSKTANKIIKRNKYVFDALSAIPWIKMIGITGSVGCYNATNKDDIDIFVVSERNRLWITRFFLFLTLKALGKYPSGKHSRGKICPNIMIDEKNLVWQKKKQNIYTANEIINMQPIYQKDNTYFKFIQANKWAQNYLGNFKITFPKRYEATKKQSELIDTLEEKLMNMQLKYMKKKQTSEITRKGFIHFNVKDSSPNILKEYKRSLKKIGPKIKSTPKP